MTRKGSGNLDPSAADMGPDADGRLTGLSARAAEGMAGKTAGYSFFVGIMRYALPLVALILLGLIVVWPLMTGREDGFRITYSEMSDVDGSLKMVNARYIGTDERNQPFTVTASEANQPEPNSTVILLQDITADIFMSEEADRWYALTASEGVYERTQKLLDLAGGVTIYSDEGHELVTATAHVDLGRGFVEGDTAVQAQGPLGLLNAGNFRLIDRGEKMFFGNRVKLVVFPGTRKN